MFWKNIWHCYVWNNRRIARYVSVMCNKKQRKYFLFDLTNIIIVAALYIANNYFFKKIFNHTELNLFFICYFNDLICPFGFISFLNIGFSFFKHRIRKFGEIELWCFSSGLVWEYFAPLIKTSAIADPYDLLCYILGGAGYYWLSHIFQKLKLSKTYSDKKEIRQ